MTKHDAKTTTTLCSELGRSVPRRPILGAAGLAQRCSHLRVLSPLSDRSQYRRCEPLSAARRSPTGTPGSAPRRPASEVCKANASVMRSRAHHHGCGNVKDPRPLHVWAMAMTLRPNQLKSDCCCAPPPPATSSADHHAVWIARDEIDNPPEVLRCSMSDTRYEDSCWAPCTGCIDNFSRPSARFATNRRFQFQ